MACEQAVFRFVEIFGHKPRRNQTSIKAESPCVIGADQSRGIAAFRLTNGRSTMPADVEEGANAICIFANDDDLFIANTKQEIIALVRDPRHMTCKKPFLANDFVEISFEHRFTGVKFLIKAVAYLRVCGEPLHCGIRCFGRHILIRAFEGSYNGLSDAVTG